MTYMPFIDGLRAIAVLGVLFFHADLGVSGGFIGVDVFFVISGYLITGLILRDLKRGDFSILQFWERRARRILPALFVVAMTTLLLGWFLLLPTGYRSLGSSVLLLSVFSSNFYFLRNSGGYFDGPSEEMPLLHTWSLSLEEQFYIIVPLVLVVLFRKDRSGWAFCTIAAVFLTSLALSIYKTPRDPSATFYLLPTRAWELAAGSLVTFAQPIERKHVRSLLSWLGMLSIGIPLFIYDSETAFPGAAAFPPVAGTAFLIWSGISRSRAPDLLPYKFLSSKPMVWIGLLSYSLYLWHWPLLAFNQYVWVWKDSKGVKAMILAISLLIAWISLRFVERPFRTKTFIKSRTLVFALSAAAITALCMPSFIIRKIDGEIAKSSEKPLGNRGPYHVETPLSAEDDVLDSMIRLGDDQSRPSFLLVGDSHAQAVAPALNAAAIEHNVSGLAAFSSGHLPLLGLHPREGGYDRGRYSRLFRHIKTKNIDKIILVGRWWLAGNARSNYTNDSVGLEMALDRTFNLLTANNHSVYLLQQVPQFTDTLKVRTNWYLLFDFRSLSWVPNSETTSLSGDDLQITFEKQNAVFKKMKQKYPHVEFLSPLKYLKNDIGMFPLKDHGGFIYFDDDHLSEYGALKLKPLFEFLKDGEQTLGLNDTPG